MAELRFYKVVRNDGGVRHGIKNEDNDIWMRFYPGSDLDLSVMWYVQVKFEGESLPEEPEAMRQLFLDHTEQIQNLLAQVIEELRYDGTTSTVPTWSEKISLPDGITLKVAFSPIWRMEAREVVPRLMDLKQNWKEHLEDLELVAPVSAN